MKVYIVSTGSYSDWCINRIFIEKEKAYKYAEVLHDANNVEEYETSDDVIDAVIDNRLYIRGQIIWSTNESVDVRITVEDDPFCPSNVYEYNESTKEWKKICSDLDSYCGETSVEYEVKEFQEYYQNYDGSNAIVIKRKIQNDPSIFDERKNKITRALYDLKAYIVYLQAEGFEKERIKEIIQGWREF